MGYGEYGGNGSVHWYGSHKRDRNNGNGKSTHDYHEVDEYPGQANGGDFTIQVFGLKPGTSFKADANGTLEVKVKIKHHATVYTEQVLITWPDP